MTYDPLRPPPLPYPSQRYGMNLDDLNDLSGSFVIIVDGIIRGLLFIALIKYLYSL